MDAWRKFWIRYIGSGPNTTGTTLWVCREKPKDEDGYQLIEVVDVAALRQMEHSYKKKIADLRSQVSKFIAAEEPLRSFFDNFCEKVVVDEKHPGQCYVKLESNQALALNFYRERINQISHDTLNS